MCRTSHIRKHTFPIWHQPSIWSMHNCGIVFFTQLFPIFDKPRNPLNNIFLVIIGFTLLGFGSPSGNIALLFSFVFQIKIPSGGLQLGVVQIGLYRIVRRSLSRIYNRNYWGLVRPTRWSFSATNIRFYEILEVKHLFNQMGTHWNNVQINVRFHE